MPENKITALPADIVRMASERAFGARLITNVHRGLVVEAIISTALCPEWEWCSEDYFPYDFRHPSGLKLEVKQSAACQSWEAKIPSKAMWDVKPRKQTWDGVRWVPQPGRAAGLYVFGWHPVTDRMAADHRDPLQWRFFVIATTDLPPINRLSYARAEQLSSHVAIDELAAEVSTVAGLRALRQNGERAVNQSFSPAMQDAGKHESTDG